MVLFVRQRSPWTMVLAILTTSACTVPSGAERGGWVEPELALFETGPYILLGAPGTARITVKDDRIPAPVVEWWVAPAGDPSASEPVRHQVKAARYEDLWVATLTDLPVGPSIRYRVTSTRGTSPEYTFRAGTPQGARFRFAAFGDTRDGHNVHRAVVEAVNREEVDFLLHTGDMVESGGRQDQWMRFFQIERPLLVDTPIVPAVGNHDMSGRDYFRRYFLHSKWADDRHYYAFDWGQLRVVTVDSGIECRDGCAQYAFAERALAEGARRGQLMVLALHHPPYSSGKHGSATDIQKPITELARRHGVELVITGHDHNYERTRPIDGTVYVVSGSAGAPVRPVQPRWFTAEARTEPHYVLVDVEGSRLIVRGVNLRGDTFDTHVIDDNPPQVN
jgi:3',5'-cyclic AMP phosphodiesterase CpdA